MRDSYSREINYLRLSITDRCNFRCKYCMPEQGITKIPHDKIISYEHIVRLVQAASEIGINKIRLTGGEPLTRKDLPKLVKKIDGIDGIDDLSLTTNGSLLEGLSNELASSGLDRVNVSLDAIDPDKFTEITRRCDVEKVLSGISAATEAGLTPVKINTVIVKGMNESEILPLVDFAVANELPVRFIELMPMGEAAKRSLESLSLKEVTEIIKRKWDLSKTDGPHGNGPATYYRVRNGEREGMVGFIFPLSKNFCDGCNRIRMTSRGTIRPCLARDEEYTLDIDNTSIEELSTRLAEIIKRKPYEHKWDTKSITAGEMSKIGG